MNLKPWDLREFLIKFLSVQGGAISALLMTKTTDAWAWGNCLFIGLCLAIGVDTATWIAKSRESE